jgi:oxalate---CoA ligase
MEDRTRVDVLPKLIAGPEFAMPDNPAILAPGRTPLGRDRLAAHVRENAEKLRTAGFGPRDRLAIVLPNGPEMATALLIAMASGAAAPLNPGYSRDEFDFYLGDLEARALLIRAGMSGPAPDVAFKRGLPVVELEPEASSEAGSFRLSWPAMGPPVADEPPGPEDIALLLHTSGTTSRPKLVPLTRSNLLCSAGNLAESLRLSPADRCLNVMPLFHIHGIVAALLASLSAGGSVVCAGAFTADDFFSWLNELHPTWYTAVPTIHQAVLKKAHDDPGALKSHALRFIRSCSASLSPSVMSELEGLFGVPVVEAYGMTEASHQITCNPLPPGPRKPGSVGVPTGVGVAVLDGSGRPLQAGVSGEIAVSGRNVTAGYLDDPTANAAAFIDGRLRTGDMGHLDPDGYLFLSGRLKEMINRGGEKISPREVDDVLAAHPAVAQVAAFSVPDTRLGEDIAAAVVLRSGRKAEEHELRAWVAERLAYFKVPKRIVFVSEIPKGPTGKLRRTDLARTLGLAEGAAKIPGREPGSGTAPSRPASAAEELMLGLMKKALGARGLDVEEGFFDAGGDSLQAAALLAEVEARFGREIPMSVLIINSSARQLAAVIDGGAAPPSSVLVPVKPDGSRPPFFCVHPHDGRATLFFALARYLEADQPLYAFQDVPGEAERPAPGGIERMAARYVAAMRALRPEGPYLIGGYCFGALVAFEMARLLDLQGTRPARLVLMDGYAPGFPRPLSCGRLAGPVYAFIDRARRVRPLLAYVSHLPRERKRTHLLGLAKTLMPGPLAASSSLPGRENDAEWGYAPKPYQGAAVLLKPTREPLGFGREAAMGWDRFIDGGFVVDAVPGYHRSLIFEPRLRSLAGRLDSILRRAL